MIEVVVVIIFLLALWTQFQLRALQNGGGIHVARDIQRGDHGVQTPEGNQDVGKGRVEK